MEGLWSWARFRRLNTEDILIVKLYVSQEHYGVFSSATQQYVALCEEEGREMNIRDAFRRDLKGLLDKLVCPKFVMDDFNCSPTNHFSIAIQQEKIY